MGSSTNISRDWIKDLVLEFINTSPRNTMKKGTGEPAWDTALVGFASGADPIWQQYKEYVGAFHWTPWEVFNQHRSKEPAAAEELTVISWVLPQREFVRKSNRRSRKYPSEAWARIRVFGEEFNTARGKRFDGLHQPGTMLDGPEREVLGPGVMIEDRGGRGRNVPQYQATVVERGSLLLNPFGRDLKRLKGNRQKMVHVVDRLQQRFLLVRGEQLVGEHLGARQLACRGVQAIVPFEEIVVLAR